MFQKRMQIIATIGLAIGILLETSVVMACPQEQVPCGENSCCECDITFTTENGGVECLMDITDVFVIVCSCKVSY